MTFQCQICHLPNYDTQVLRMDSDDSLLSKNFWINIQLPASIVQNKELVGIAVKMNNIKVIKQSVAIQQTDPLLWHLCQLLARNIVTALMGQNVPSHTTSSWIKTNNSNLNICIFFPPSQLGKHINTSITSAWIIICYCKIHTSLQEGVEK